MPAAVDNFASNNGPSLTSAPVRFGVVTPSDVALDELPEVPRGLYVGVAGDVSLKDMAGNTVLFKAMPVGWHAMRFRQIFATATTATTMVWGA